MGLELKAAGPDEGRTTNLGTGHKAMRRVTGFAAALAVFVLSAGVTPAAAQTDAENGAAQQQARQPWSVQCSATAREAPVDCAIEQRAVVSENGRLLTQLTIRVPADTRKPVMMVQTPLGPFLPEGISLDVDGGDAVKLDYQTCDANGCYAGSPVSDQLLQSMFRGQKLNLTIRALNKQEIKIPLELTGFTAAYRKIQ